MSVRYPSLAHRKQTYRRAEAALNRAVGIAPTTNTPRDISYAADLLPTLDGHVHGIIGINPWRLQCDGCGAVEEPTHLVLMQTHFAFGPDRAHDPRRLCPDCQQIAGWSRS